MFYRVVRHEIDGSVGCGGFPVNTNANVGRYCCICWFHYSPTLHNVFRRKASHDSNFGVYQDDPDSSFKIGRPSFKYNDKYVFVDGNKYKAIQGLWELLSHNLIIIWSFFKEDKHNINKYYSSLIRIVNYSPTGRIRTNKGLKYTRYISRLFPERQVPWESLQ
jgi:hypothetical protein